jgi:peroxiredoxin
MKAVQKIALLACMVTLSALSLAAPQGIDQVVPIKETLPQILDAGVKGTVDLGQLKGDQNLVIFFFSEQCGVTFFYRSRIRQLVKDFEKRGFRFVGVRCGQREDLTKPLQVPETHDFNFPIVDDVDGVLLERFKVKQSLTFAVIDRNDKLRYFGGFDNNMSEPKVTHSYLRNAMRQLSMGQPISIKVGVAVGCAIIPMSKS